MKAAINNKTSTTEAIVKVVDISTNGDKNTARKNTTNPNTRVTNIN